MRNRSGSEKRKLDDTVSYAHVTSLMPASSGSPASGNFIPSDKIEEMSTNIATVSSLCEKMDKVMESEPESELKTVLVDMSKAIRLLNNNQQVIVKSQTQPVISPNNTGTVNMVSLGTIPKRNRRSKTRLWIPPPTPTVVRPEVKKFRDAVARAENSTLIFNLNMGRVPIMNQETMSNRATLALAAMAAEEEDRQGGIPTEDTIAGIDDVLSVVRNVEFFGRKTKTYINPKDDKSGSYCTVPVRYEFANKEDRFEAEKYLKNKCGIHCSTPYPIILRECIRQVSDKVRKDYPGNHVKVSVDTGKFCLRVATRAASDSDKQNKWEYFDRFVPLPEAVLNVDARKVPEGFKVLYFTPGPEKGLADLPVKLGSGSENPGDMERVENSTPPSAF
jgi:hypothetical protein